jgi:hypothetical protein
MWMGLLAIIASELAWFAEQIEPLSSDYNAPIE